MIGSMCSGYGGLDLAVAQHYGQDVAWHVENDPAPSKVLAARFPGVPNLHDLTTIDWATLSPVDILTAGYPCQPFSHAGKRKGSKDERHLWPYIATAIGRLRPRVVVLENVRGHVSLGLDVVLADLAALGYDTRWGVVRASDAGAPHGRARIFIVAHTHDAGLEGREPTRGRDVPDRGTTADTANVGHERRWTSRDGRPGPEDRGVAAADTSGERHGRRENSASVGRLDSEDASQARERERGLTDDRSATDWGIYEPAIRKWEHLTRPAPRPTEPTGRDGANRLSPRFVEWLMGLPEGWVTGVEGVSRNDQLKILGNGVVPQQSILALNVLAPVSAVA